MSFCGSLIIERENEWCIHVANETRIIPKTSEVSKIVATVSDLLENSKSTKSGCVIAPASNSCFFARLNFPADFNLRDRPALIYELENHLPIDAESMAANFTSLPESVSQDQKLPEKSLSAIAVEVKDWKPLADTLETKGIPVTNIIPDVALAVTSLHEKHSLSGFSNLILCRENHADMITLADDRILSWKYTKLEAESLKRHKSLDIQECNEVLVVGCTEEQATLIRNNVGPVRIDTEPLEMHHLHGANSAVSKPASIEYNLRRDGLASDDPLRPITKQLSWLAFAIGTLLLVTIAGSWWRSARIEARTSEILQAQSTAFKQSFPDTRVPASLLRRVRSEHTRIMGSRNASKQIEAPGSAAELMGVLLASLPTNTRARISSIDIRNGNMELTFQVQHFVDAGVIAEALSQAGFEVSQPATAQKDAKTFESTIQAKWNDGISESTHKSSGEQAVPSQDQDGNSQTAHRERLPLTMLPASYGPKPRHGSSTHDDS